MKRVPLRNKLSTQRAWKARSGARQRLKRQAAERSYAQTASALRRASLSNRSAKRVQRDKEYRPKREAALRDGDGCYFTRNSFAGVPKCYFGLEVHHRLSRARGGDDSPSNLVVLCGRCHDWIHHYVEGRRLAEDLGLLRRQRDA